MSVSSSPVSFGSYIPGWPRNISEELFDVIRNRDISSDARICFADDVYRHKGPGGVYVGSSVIPVSEFKDSRPNGVFTENMRYSKIVKGTSIDGTCMHSLYSRLEHDPNIQLFVICARFSPRFLQERFEVEQGALVRERRAEYDAERIKKISKMIFNAMPGGWQEYVYKQQAGNRGLATELLKKWRKKPKRIFV